MNIIIAGDGEVGMHVAQLLADEHHNITFIDQNPLVLEDVASHYDVMTIQGSSISVDTLEEAEAKNADLLIAVLHDEAINLLTAILGKRLGAKRTIARVSNREFSSARNLDILKEKGVDIIINPEQEAAQEIVHLLQHTAATEIFNFSEGKLQLFLIELDEDAPVCNKTLTDLAQEYPDLNFRAVAVHRAGETIIPGGNDRFMAGDLAYVISKPDGVPLLLELGGKTNYKIEDIMIIGGGRIGRRLASQLENELNIKMFERDTARANALTAELSKTLIINADARDTTILEDEDIKGMDAFIAVANHSETNILTCLHAKRMGVKRTIALVENIEYIDIAQNVGITTIINKKLTTAGAINMHTMKATVTTAKCLSGVNANALELLAAPKSAVTKKPLMKLRLPDGCIIGGVIRDGEGHIATGNLQLQEGDRAVVFAVPAAIHKVSKMFR